MNDSILVTGGAGFIGSNFVMQWLARESAPLINLDLSYLRRTLVQPCLGR